MHRSQPQIILASSSVYRSAILTRIGLTHAQYSPNINEQPKPAERAKDLVIRLAIEKAVSAQNIYNNALIIGSDQVVQGTTGIMGKPASRQQAIEQIMMHSGQEVRLCTGVALFNTKTQRLQSAVDYYHIQYKTLDPIIVERYVVQEQPYDCCGSLRAEGPGINLLQWMRGDDPNTLIGLPVLKLCTMLENEGYNLY